MTDGLKLLTGVRVVALEQYISGPYCTSILADAGAEVVKVERPATGDPRRTYDPKLGEDADYVSGGFASYNRGKQSVEMDLGTDAGLEQFQHMLAGADVLVSNLRPGALARYGLTPEVLSTRYPRLIVCEISGFGVTGGPYAQWPAFDSVIQAMSGLSSLLGSDPEHPSSAPMGSMDLLAGAYAAIGVLTALVGRAATGRGVHVDAAMYDIGAVFLERPLVLHEFTGQVPTAGADRFSPVGAFRTGDQGWVSIVIPTDDMWRRCCRAIGRPELVDHPDFDTVLKRAAVMADRIVPLLESWAQDKDRFQAATELRDAGQPAGVVQDIGEVRRCPQLAHRGLFAEFDDPRATPGMRLPRLPLLFDGAGARPGVVPALGSHTAAWIDHPIPAPPAAKETP